MRYQRRKFTIADLHLGHKGMCSGESRHSRPWDTPEEMTRDMIGLWNAEVRDEDLTYVLGDVVINRRYLAVMALLHGEKVLIKGNHDVFRPAEYLACFSDILGCKVVTGAILTHIPIHPDELARFGKNIHGHLHDRKVRQKIGIFSKADDPRYICVSAEQTGYKPVLLDSLLD